MAGRPGLAGQLGERHGARIAARGRVIPGKDEVDRVEVQVMAVHAREPRARLVLPFVGQDEIDVPERERGQRLLRLGLHELAAQAGRLLRERLHRRGGQVDRDRLERGDSPPPGHGARGRGQLGLRELGPPEQRLGVAHEDQRGVGQPDASARSLE